MHGHADEIRWLLLTTHDKFYYHLFVKDGLTTLKTTVFSKDFFVAIYSKKR